MFVSAPGLATGPPHYTGASRSRVLCASRLSPLFEARANNTWEVNFSFRYTFDARGANLDGQSCHKIVK